MLGQVNLLRGEDDAQAANADDEAEAADSEFDFEAISAEDDASSRPRFEQNFEQMSDASPRKPSTENENTCMRTEYHKREFENSATTL